MVDGDPTSTANCLSADNLRIRLRGEYAVNRRQAECEGRCR
jgi:hypothetical protein